MKKEILTRRRKKRKKRKKKKKKKKVEIFNEFFLLGFQGLM